MDWGDRLVWLLIGAILGYIVRMLQDIKQEVHEVDEIIKRNGTEKDDGFARFPILLDALIVVLAVLTVWSFTRGEEATDRANAATAAVAAQNERISTIVSCTLESQVETIRALNERTTYTTDQVDSNVDVLKAQLAFLRLVLFIPPVPDSVRRAQLETYTDTIDEYVDIAGRTKTKAQLYTYPTNQELSECLGAELTKKKEQENEQRESGTE